MRRFFYAMAFLAFAAQLRAQSPVLFKIKYLPNRVYSGTTKMVMNNSATYEGNAELLKQMKANGTKLPVVMNAKTNIASVIKTGALTAGKEVPFKMNINQAVPIFTVNGAVTPVPDKPVVQNITGKYDVNGKLAIQSAQGRPMNDSLTNAVMSILKTIIVDVQFPNTPIKVGDSFAQESDMAIPIPGFTSDMLMRTTYKLLSITNGKALFSMAFVTTMYKPAGTGEPIMTGKGTGKLVFDIALHYAESMTQTIKMDYLRPMQKQNVNMRGIAQMSIEQKTVLK